MSRCGRRRPHSCPGGTPLCSGLFATLMRQETKPPTYEILLAATAVAPSGADLPTLKETVRACFMGTRREELEATVERREAELPDGGLGR